MGRRTMIDSMIEIFSGCLRFQNNDILMKGWHWNFQHHLLKNLVATITAIHAVATNVFKIRPEVEPYMGSRHNIGFPKNEKSY